jgi:prepilin-type N-terminal cleavage/methylation domain-containing protein
MKQARGFTLIELAIVLVIITILIGGLAVPLSAQIQARRIGETKRTLEEAREAIIGYAMSNKIPGMCRCLYNVDTTLDLASSTCPLRFCPHTSTATLSLPIEHHYLACPDLTKDDPEPGNDNDDDGLLSDLNNGREDRYKTGTNAGDCATASGNLPWVTLGTGAQDAWGNRLGYRLTNSPSTGSTDPDDTYGSSTTGFLDASTGDNQICATSLGGCSTGNVASHVPAILISHGPNGWGARNVNGTKLKNPTSADETENTDADTSFVSRSPSKAGDAGDEFDDLVVWISDGLLRGRVCTERGCP